MKQSKLSRGGALKQLAAVPVIAAGAVAALGAPAAAKTSQQAAKYQNKPKGAQKCSNCRFFQGPSGCQIVAGKISPNGWCALWVKK